MLLQHDLQQALLAVQSQNACFLSELLPFDSAE